MANVVLITGADGGLGTHVTARFAEAGWQIIATCYTTDSCEQLRARANTHVVQCDVTDAAACQALAAELPQTLSAAVHLVGGIRAGKLIEETSPEDFEHMWKLNAVSTYNILRATVPLLKRTHGAFVAIGARTVLHTETYKALYGAAKAAVVHLVLAAAEEGRNEGLRANVIVPSIIRTPANLQWAQGGEEQRWVDPRDIAELIFFLCSEAGRGVTGCVIPMFGKLPA